MATGVLLGDLQKVRHRWGWFLALGIASVILGIAALILVPASTLASVLILGWVLVISGVVEAVHAFRVRGWGGVALHLVAGILGILVGLLIVTHPVAGALVWTLLFASFFTVFGLFRLITAVMHRHPHWGWAVFDGAVTFLLGILLWIRWPSSGLWFLGTALGVSLILRGWSYIMFAQAIRRLAPDVREIRQAA
jgi:uncharacterized membrane protein HdeD (DUF308 family)